MTRVAAIYDIHGNLPALDAVLAEIYRIGVERIVVGGDVLPGPMPAETLGRLFELDLPVHCILGNGEVAVLDERAGAGSAALPEHARSIVRWTGEQLRPEDERAIASWPKVLRLDIEGLGGVLFCHGTPRDENEIFTCLTPEDALRPVFEGLGADWLLLGPDVELRHTEYDLDAAAAEIRRTPYPQADDHAANYILKPPSGEAMLEMFTAAGLK